MRRPNADIGLRHRPPQLAATEPAARAMDLLIAATAHAHGARLYTRDSADLLGADEWVEVVAV